MAKKDKNTEKILRIGIVQGGRIIEERLLRHKESITIGQSPKNKLMIPSPRVPMRFRLIEVKGGRYALCFEKGMLGKVLVGDEVLDLKAIAMRKLAERKDNRFAYPLTDESRGKIVLGDVTLLFQFVPPPPEVPRLQLPAEARGAWWRGVEKGMASTFIASLLFLGGGGGFLHFQHEHTWKYMDFSSKAGINTLMQRLVEAKELEEDKPREEKKEDGEGEKKSEEGIEEGEDAKKDEKIADAAAEDRRIRDAASSDRLTPDSAAMEESGMEGALDETGSDAASIDMDAAAAALEGLAADQPLDSGMDEVGPAGGDGSDQHRFEKARSIVREKSLVGSVGSEFGESFGSAARDALQYGVGSNRDSSDFGEGFVASDGRSVYSEFGGGEYEGGSGVGLASLTGIPSAGIGELLPPELSGGVETSLLDPSILEDPTGSISSEIAAEATKTLEVVATETEVVTEKKKEITLKRRDIIGGGTKKSKKKLMAVIRKKTGAFERCLQSAGLKNPNVGGKLVLKITVETGGRASVSVASDDTREPSLARCIMRIIEKIPFPPAKKKTSFKLPFILEGL